MEKKIDYLKKMSSIRKSLYNKITFSWSWCDCLSRLIELVIMSNMAVSNKFLVGLLLNSVYALYFRRFKLIELSGKGYDCENFWPALLGNMCRKSRHSGTHTDASLIEIMINVSNILMLLAAWHGLYCL